MFIEAAILGLIIGLIRNGRLSRLSYVNFNMTSLVYISSLFYISIIIMNLGLINYNSNLYVVFIVISYILILLFLIVNMDKKFMAIPLIGLCSNLICFIVNSFKFPLSLDAVNKFYGEEIYNLLIAGKIKFFIPDENAVLSFLGNIIPIDKIYTKVIISPGDVIISIGIILILQTIIADKFIQNRRNITFSKNLFK